MSLSSLNLPSVREHLTFLWRALESNETLLQSQVFKPASKALISVLHHAASRLNTGSTDFRLRICRITSCCCSYNCLTAEISERSNTALLVAISVFTTSSVASATMQSAAISAASAALAANWDTGRELASSGIMVCQLDVFSQRLKHKSRSMATAVTCTAAYTDACRSLPLLARVSFRLACACSNPTIFHSNRCICCESSVEVAQR